MNNCETTSDEWDQYLHPKAGAESNTPATCLLNGPRILENVFKGDDKNEASHPLVSA